MPAENSLTSTTWNPWDGTSYADGTTDQIEFDYSLLGFTPSSSDSYKSTSGDIFKVYIDGVRIYRTHDATYAGGTGFLESGDTATTLNGASATWSNTSDTVWEIDTTAQVIRVDKSEVWGTTLYADDGLYASTSSGSNITFSSSTIIELRRSAQNESSPSVDFSNASILTEQDLDNSSLNVFHMAQQAVVTANKGIIFDTGAGVWDAQQDAVDKKIRGVATPTADNDAATKVYADSVRSSVTADLALTNADVVLTHADVVSTNADVVSTNADVVSTNQDTIDTAADLVATNQDTIDTAADLVATNQDTIDTAADRVQTGLDRAATAADKVATNADVVLTNADELLTRADTVLTAADVVSTNADVVSTNADVVTTTASAAAAKASAAAVANSLDAFDDTYLGVMSDSSTQGTNPTTNGTWAKDSSAITVVSGSNIKVGQVVTGAGMPSPPPNVISVAGTAVVVSENMAAAGSAVALTFTGYGVYGTYNGTKVGPTTDNDNGALADGMLYFNTSDNNMMVYKTTGATWITATSAGETSLMIHKFTASGSETQVLAASFTPTLTYTAANIAVFLNGVRLDATDYVATNGNDITGLSALAASDEVVVMAFKSFEVADAVSAVSGGTFNGAVTFSAGLTANTVDINGGTIDGCTITGNISGNAGGTAATVTGATQSAITTATNLVTVGALDAGSITSNFTSIDVGAGAIATTGALTGGTATITGLITANGGIETDTNSKVVQKGAFMQSSTHQALTLGY